MSVYIKNFKYPENCWQCPMVGGYELSDEVKTRYSTLHCRLLKCKTPAGVRPQDCPLLPVPDHGRLIDADKIGLTDFEIILCQADENRYKSALKLLLEKIEKMPTIIPADKESAP